MVTKAGNHGVVCSTDDVSARIEDLQLTLGEGPCIDSVRGNAPVLVPDLNSPQEIAVDRWPAFLEGAGAAGVQAVFAFPLRVGAITLGALDLYRDQPGDLVGDGFSAALMAGDAAAQALLYVDTGNGEKGGPELDFGSNYQHQVHQATGMVQVQMAVTTEAAFLMLRARAFATGRSLVDLANDVVARRLRFSTEDL